VLGIRLRAVQRGPSDQKPRAAARTCRDLGSPPEQLVDIAAAITDNRDAMGRETVEMVGEPGRKMYVCIGKAVNARSRQIRRTARRAECQRYDRQAACDQWNQLRVDGSFLKRL
jgi:hypothetical protein